MHRLRLYMNLLMQDTDGTISQINGMDGVHVSMQGNGILPVMCLGENQAIADREDTANLIDTCIDVSFVPGANALFTPISTTVYVNGQNATGKQKGDVTGINAEPQAGFLFNPCDLADSVHISSNLFDGLGNRMMMRLRADPEEYDRMLREMGLPTNTQFACNSLDMQLQALHQVLRNSSEMRADLKSNTVAEMSGLPASESYQLKMEAKNNYFRVPCSDLGPVSQKTHACLGSMLRSSAPEMTGLNLDWTQASGCNAAVVRKRPMFYCTYLMQSMLKSVTTLRQAKTHELLPSDEKKCAMLLGEFADTLLATREGARLLHDTIFQCTTQLSAVSAHYTSDTRVCGIETHSVCRGGKFFVESSMRTSGDGESQLMSGIPYTVNRALQERAEVALGTRKSYSSMNVCAESANNDCEDFSFRTRGVMHIASQMTKQGVHQLFTATAHEHDAWLQDHLPWLIRVGRAVCQGDSGALDPGQIFCEPGAALAPSLSGRVYASTLGLATGAASGNQSSSQLAKPQSRRQQYEAWTLGLQSNLSGHSFTVGFDDAGDQQQTWANGVKILYPKNRMFGEQTAVVFDVTGSAALDDVVECSFDSNSSKIRGQVTGMQHKTMWRSAANSLRNGLFAQFLQKKTGVACTGAQVKDDKNPSGFLQHVIAAGDVTFYSSDAPPLTCAGNVATPVASVVSEDVPSFGLQLPATPDEWNAIYSLLDIGLHPTPELPAMKLCRPYDIQTIGKRGRIAVVAALPKATKASVTKAADKVMRKLGGVGREVIDSKSVLVHFDGE